MRLFLILLLTALACGEAATGNSLRAQAPQSGTPRKAVIVAELQARARIELRGLDVRVGDVAAVSTPIPELTERIEQLELGTRPARGFDRKIARGEIERALTGAGLPAEQIRITGALQTLVRPASAQVPADDVRAVSDPVLDAFLRERRAAGQDVEARLRRPVRAVDAPPGRVGVSLRGRVDPDRVTATSITVAVDVLVDGEVFKTAQVVYDLQRYVTAAVTLRGVQRGEPLDASLVIDQRIPLAAGATTHYVQSADLIGKVAASRLGADRPLRAVDLAEPRIIDRDDPIRVVCRRGRIQVTVRAVALQPGSVGDRITVRSLATGRPLEAVIAGPGLCIVGGSESPLPQNAPSRQQQQTPRQAPTNDSNPLRRRG